IPLTDADRKPWLDAIHETLISQTAAGRNVVLGCSALKETYRQRLAEGLNVKLVYLKGSPELIGSRLRSRTGHFAGESILADQFAVLEEPHDALIVNITDDPEQLVEEIFKEIAGEPQARANDLFDNGKPLMRRIAWRLVPFLFLLYVTAYLDRINV